MQSWVLTPCWSGAGIYGSCREKPTYPDTLTFSSRIFRWRCVGADFLRIYSGTSGGVVQELIKCCTSKWLRLGEFKGYKQVEVTEWNYH